MQIILTIALYNYKVPVIVKKNNFTFCPGKSRENSINIFQDFPGLTNKIQGLQGLSRTAKKIQDFPGLFQDVATLLIPTQLFESFNNFFIIFFARFRVKCKLTMKFLSNLKEVNI